MIISWSARQVLTINILDVSEGLIGCRRCGSTTGQSWSKAHEYNVVSHHRHMSDVTQDDKYTACHQITKQDNDDQRNKDCITTEFCAVGQFWISKYQGWALGAATKYHPAPKAQQGNSFN